MTMRRSPKKYIVWILVASFLFLSLQASMNLARANDKEAVIESTVLPFFKALKSGDVKAVESYLGGQLASDMHVLLRENEEYPEILRSHYEGAVVQIVSAYEVSNQMVVGAQIDFTDGTVLLVDLRLDKNSDGKWTIIAQTERRL